MSAPTVNNLAFFKRPTSGGDKFAINVPRKAPNFMSASVRILSNPKSTCGAVAESILQRSFNKKAEICRAYVGAG
jgi:hypothetical protein